MLIPPAHIFAHWLANTPELLKQLCVVVVIAYLAIRVKFIRHAIEGANSDWRLRLITSFFFGGLAIVGTLSGIVVDMHNPGETVSLFNKTNALLLPGEAIIGFRDTMALSAGLCSGPWVGLGAGLIAGYHRYSLGGFVAMASGLSTAMLGLIAGVAKQFWGKASTPMGTMLVAMLGTLLHRLLLLSLADPVGDAILLTWETLLPVTVVNCVGCLVFRLVIQDLEQQAALIQAKKAELRALQAQIEPHFINGSLTTLKGLIRDHNNNDKERLKALDYTVKLGIFLNYTRKMAKENQISLEDEINVTRNYLEMQQIRFSGAFSFQIEVPESLMQYQIPPRSLLTLVQNALEHGMRGHMGILTLRILAQAESQKRFHLCVSDNGSGIAEDRRETLITQPVESESGSGHGLYQLNQALRLFFDGRANMSIDSKLGQGTQVHLKLPIRRAIC